MAKAITKIEDAKAHAHGLANDALAKMLVDGGVGKVLMDLAMMRPYLIELAKRFKHLKKGETILGYTSMDGDGGFCLGEIGRTYRACKYAMDGGNTSRKPAPNPTQKQLTAGMPENNTETVSVSPTELTEGMNIIFEGVAYSVVLTKLSLDHANANGLPVIELTVEPVKKDPVVANQLTQGAQAITYECSLCHGTFEVTADKVAPHYDRHHGTWHPPVNRPAIKGWYKMNAGEKLFAARAAGCPYCLKYKSARSCPAHGWKEKGSANLGELKRMMQAEKAAQEEQTAPTHAESESEKSGVTGYN